MIYTLEKNNLKNLTKINKYNNVKLLIIKVNLTRKYYKTILLNLRPNFSTKFLAWLKSD